MKKEVIVIIIIILSISAVSYLNRDKLLSRMIGYPYGIKKIDRVNLGLLEINNSWERYPKGNKLSATQIWINKDSIENKGYYSKKILMDKNFMKVADEEDRFKIDNQGDKQVDLVYRRDFKNKDQFRCQARIEKINKIDLNLSCYKWFEKAEIIEEISCEKADSIKLKL